MHNTSDISPPVQQESKWQYLCSAMEIALSLGDFQKDSESTYTTDEFCAIALGSINHIIHFDASAVYVVEPETSDLMLSALAPTEKESDICKEMDFLINQGSIAWAMREKRGICVLSQDGSRQILLHIIATYARIRGVFMGIFPSKTAHRPDGANEFISLFLRTAATSLESIEYVTLLNKKNDLLHKQVDEKVAQVLSKERQLAHTRKLNAIASLAGGIAHEFNNALTSLTGYNDLVKMDFGDPQKVLQYSKKSSSLLDRMASLTKQLLSYSRGGRYKSEDVAVKTLVDDCLSSLKKKLKSQVRIDVTPGPTDVYINCDVKQMQEALRAVITNAIEAVKENGQIDIIVNITDTDANANDDDLKLKPGSYAVLEIRDNGCGMDQNTLDRMFEPFFSTKFTGRGLSMAAVHGILENHHGAIHVDSVLERETTVKIYLPLVSVNKRVARH
jgi:signal transduction histidine kinase